MTYLTVEVPGEFTRATAFADIETRKVPTGGYVMANGEILKNRWQAFAVGLAKYGQIYLLADDNEGKLLTMTAACLNPKSSVTYSATRQFDEMILKGRFTNARRAHEPVSFYPSLPGVDRLVWRCLKPGAPEPRGADVASRDVPEAWRRGLRTVVLIHLLRDVAELILLGGDPDAACAGWCRRVLADREFAAAQLRSC